MSGLELQEHADYSIHESFQAETLGYEDHTFCGIMFNVEVKTTLPIEYIEMDSISVRGALGPLTAWFTRGTYDDKFSQKDQWTQIYEGTLPSSMSTLSALELQTKFRVRRGEKFALYVHSSRHDDSAIVYDDERHEASHEDRLIRVLPGMAHISPVAFSSQGWWGWGWRPRREFVGRLSFGVRYIMWQPKRDLHVQFPRKFRQVAQTFTMCSYRRSCLLSRLPRAVIAFILNMCPWNWFGDLDSDEDTKVRTSADLQAEGEQEGRRIGWTQYGDYRRLIAEHQMAHGGLNMDDSGDEDDDDDDDDDEDFGEEDEEDEDGDVTMHSFVHMRHAALRNLILRTFRDATFSNVDSEDEEDDEDGDNGSASAAESAQENASASVHEEGVHEDVNTRTNESAHADDI